MFFFFDFKYSQPARRFCLVSVLGEAYNTAQLLLQLHVLEVLREKLVNLQKQLDALEKTNSALENANDPLK